MRGLQLYPWGSVGRGLNLGQTEQKVTSFLGDSSGMWVVVRLENTFCRCGLFCENEGHHDLEKQRVRAKCLVYTYKTIWK